MPVWEKIMLILPEMFYRINIIFSDIITIRDITVLALGINNSSHDRSYLIQVLLLIKHKCVCVCVGEGKCDVHIQSRFLPFPNSIRYAEIPSLIFYKEHKLNECYTCILLEIKSPGGYMIFEITFSASILRLVSLNRIPNWGWRAGM